MLSEKPEMRGDWKELLYQVLYTVAHLPNCVNSHIVTFGNSTLGNSMVVFGTLQLYVRTAHNSRLVFVPFQRLMKTSWWKFVLTVIAVTCPATNTPVLWQVDTDGSSNCTQRQEKAHMLTTRTTTANKEYYKQLSNMPSSAVAAGNVTQCKSPGVFR